MKNKNVLKILSCGIALVSLVICLFLCGEISGFNKGYRAAINLDESLVGGFITHGPNFYEFIGSGYVIIAFCFCICFVAKLVSEKQIELDEDSFLPYVCLSSIGVIVYQYWQMLQFKYRLLANTEVNYPYDDWLRISIQFDWFCVSSAIVLLIFQIGILVLKYTNKSIK